MIKILLFIKPFANLNYKLFQNSLQFYNIMSVSRDKINHKENRSASAKKSNLHIWAAKDPWSKPEDKPATSSSKRPRKGSHKKVEKPVQAAGQKYQAKLMLEEDSEKKTVLIKIGQRTSIRQVIQYCIDKLKDDWVITINAFQLEMTKALQSCEILKTRVSFLHQANKLISFKVEGSGEKAEESTRVRSGIAITLSRNPLQDVDPVGYQKPKPRQFLQPPPSKPKKEEKEDDLAPAKGGNRQRRPRRASLDEMKEQPKKS